MPAALQLQSRDLLLFAELGEVGLLDTTAIHARHFPHDRTGKACLRRLGLHAKHDLLEAILPSVSFGLPHGGRLPTIYRLTPRGAEVLTEITGDPPRRLIKSSPRPEKLLHRLGCAKLHLLTRDACRAAALAPPHWIAEYDSVPGVGISVPLHELFLTCLSYRQPDGSKHTCWPDAAALVHIPSQPIGAASASYPLIALFEYDRSTENLKQVARKLPGYHQLLTRGDWRKFFPDVSKPTVRVFVVVQSEERLRNISTAIRDLPGADAFRLVTVGSLRPETFFSDTVWRTVTGEARAILKAATPAA